MPKGKFPVGKGVIFGTDETKWSTQQHDDFPAPATELFVPIVLPPLRTSVVLGSDETTWSTSNFLPAPVEPEVSPSSSASRKAKRSPVSYPIHNPSPSKASDSGAAVLTLKLGEPGTVLSMTSSSAAAASPAVTTLVNAITSNDKHISAISYGHDKSATAAAIGSASLSPVRAAAAAFKASKLASASSSR